MKMVNKQQPKGEQMKATTAEQAANMTTRHGKSNTTVQMLCKIADIRNDKPELAQYLSHPEIIVGLGVGRFGVGGLERRLTEMHAADEGK